MDGAIRVRGELAKAVARASELGCDVRLARHARGFTYLEVRTDAATLNRVALAQARGELVFELSVRKLHVA